MGRISKTPLSVLAAGVILTLSIVSPALGGPSIGSVAKTAKKALSTGKKALSSARAADRRARTADSRARTAEQSAAGAAGLAGTANAKADQALARPVVTAGGITTVTGSAAIPAGGFEIAIAACPPGQRAISGGGTATSAAGGLWASLASADRAAWFAGGEDLAGGGGTVTAYAYCVPGGQAAAAGHRRLRLRREADRLERRRRSH
jgi:hypothetical protein